MEMTCNRCGKHWNLEKLCRHWPGLVQKFEAILMCSCCAEFAATGRVINDTVLLTLNVPEMEPFWRYRLVDLTKL